MDFPSKKDNKMSYGYRMDTPIYEGPKFDSWTKRAPQMEPKKNVKRTNFNQMTTGKIMLQLKPSLRDFKQSGVLNFGKNPFIGKTMLKLKPKDLRPMEMSSDLAPQPTYQSYKENKMITEKIMLQKKEPQFTKVREQKSMDNNYNNYISTGYKDDNVGKMFLIHRGPPSCPAQYVSEMNPYKAVPTTDWGKNFGFGHQLFVQTRDVKKNGFGEKHCTPGFKQYTQSHPQFSSPLPMKNVFQESHQEKHLHERRGRKIEALPLVQTPNRPSIPFAGRDSPHSPIIKARFSPFKTCQNNSPSWLLAKNVAEFALESPQSLKGHGLANCQQKDFFY